MDDATREVRDDLHGLLVALVKAALVGDPAAAGPWRRQGEVRRTALRGRTGAAPPGADLDAVWARAVREAEGDGTVRRAETASPILPIACPLTWDQITGLAFDAAAERIRVSASTG